MGLPGVCKCGLGWVEGFKSTAGLNLSGMSSTCIYTVTTIFPRAPHNVQGYWDFP